MSGEKHTPGPWFAVQIEGTGSTGEAVAFVQGPIRITRDKSCGYSPEDARLIAAAPDHALICWAMCMAAGRWDAWGDGRGEFCINGTCYSTKIDEFGCPIVTETLRAAISKASGSQP